MDKNDFNINVTEARKLISIVNTLAKGCVFSKEEFIKIIEVCNDCLNRIENDDSEKNDKKILDACCGSRMFWFDKNNKNVLYADNREVNDVLCDNRKLIIKPDVLMDFRNMPFEDNSFYMVVFDPPHLIRAGETSWLAKKYGVLPTDWKEYISKGFDECMRVLKPYGTLIFKWNEEQIKLQEILSTINYSPLFGNKRAKTHWLVFMKDVC